MITSLHYWWDDNYVVSSLLCCIWLSVELRQCGSVTDRVGSQPGPTHHWPPQWTLSMPAPHHTQPRHQCNHSKTHFTSRIITINNINISITDTDTPSPHRPTPTRQQSRSDYINIYQITTQNCIEQCPAVRVEPQLIMLMSRYWVICF